jgi:hypothetical protein
MNFEEIKEQLKKEKILFDDGSLNYQLLFKDKTEDEIKIKIAEGFNFLNSSTNFSNEQKENFKKDLEKLESEFYKIKKSL